MADGMLVVDLQNRLVEMNPAFLKITGLTEEAVIGRPINELLADRPIWGSSMASQNNIVSKAIKIWK
jgi:PAS domain S-box-containing protein